MAAWYKGIEIPENEQERQAAVASYHVLDTPPEVEYDDITALAATLAECRISYISIFDDKRSWLKSKYGLPPNRPDRPRELSLCSPTILQSDLLVVPDLSRVPRYADLPAVMNPPHAKFYCAMPLINPEGYALGTLCVWDPEARDMTPEHQQCMRRLGRQVMANLESRRTLIKLQQQQAELQESRDRLHTENAAYDGLLRNVFPKIIAEKLLDSEQVDRHFYDSATVLFIDFCDFSRTTEMLEPRELIDQLDEYFSMFDQIMERFGVVKIKTVGDAYVAVAGIVQHRPDHALRVCAAANEANKAMNRINAQRRKLGLSEWLIRIGIHSGNLIAGLIGTQRLTYDVWGDGVNLARRMQENCEPGRINISESTYGLVSREVAVEARGAVHAKNKGAINMYYLSEDEDD